MNCVYLFEDAQWTHLLPMTRLRAAHELRLGARSLWQEWQRIFKNAQLMMDLRPLLRAVMLERYPDLRSGEGPPFETACLWINGRALPFNETVALADEMDINTAITTRGQLVLAKLDAQSSTGFYQRLNQSRDFDSLSQINGIAMQERPLALLEHPWDLLRYHLQLFREQGQRAAAELGRLLGQVHRKAELVNAGQMHIGPGTVIQPYAVLDASEGPIWIGPHCEIEPAAYLKGPVAVADHNRVRSHAQLRPGTSLGPHTKAGGEISHAIFAGYSNKAHGGFVGDSYVGAWVNLGAGTITSNLKNNYGNIRLDLAGSTVDTGLQLFGSIIGDYGKTGIGTLLNAGTILGIFCNVFGGGLCAKYMPNFSWGKASTRYRLEDALEMVKKMMKRRDMNLSAAEELLIRRCYEES